MGRVVFRTLPCAEHKGQDGGGLQEMVMVELQGELMCRADSEEAEFGKVGFGGIEMGTLSVTYGRPQLMIGNNMLEGKVVALPKPLIVCKSVNVGQDDDGSAAAPALRHEMLVHAVVRSKFLFTTRPNPIVASDGDKKKKQDTSEAARGQDKAAGDAEPPKKKKKKTK